MIGETIVRTLFAGGRAPATWTAQLVVDGAPAAGSFPITWEAEGDVARSTLTVEGPARFDAITVSADGVEQRTFDVGEWVVPAGITQAVRLDWLF